MEWNRPFSSEMQHPDVEWGLENRTSSLLPAARKKWQDLIFNLAKVALKLYPVHSNFS